MGQLRDAGMSRLVKRIEFEGREQLASIRVAAGLEEVATAG